MMKIFKYKATLCYIAFVVLINIFYVHMPYWSIAGSPFSTGDMIVGAIYIFRDFAQREIKHKVLLAMFVAGIISYFLASPAMAIASICAFTVAELMDWSIFTFTKKTLSKRLLLSAAISAPIDSIVFMAIYKPLTLLNVVMLSASKILGVFIIWYVWRYREKKRELVYADANVVL